MTTARICLVLLLSWPAVLATAQTPDSELAAVKAKTDLTDEDRNAVRAFIAKRLDVLRAKDDAAAAQAATELRAAFDGSENFKKAYAAACSEAFGTAYKTADVAVAARLLTLLSTFNTADALPVLLEALQDTRVGVRGAAAAGLRMLREKLAAAGRDTYTKALNALRDAGKREKARETLKLIYAALNYADLPAASDAKATAAALLDVLDERARLVAAGTAGAAGADDVGLRIAKIVLPALDEGERKRLTIATATLLQHAIEAYTAGDDKLAASHGGGRAALRDATERLILVGEELLTSLLKPDKVPAVSDNMRKLNTSAMRSEWEKWVPLLQKAVGQDFSLAGGAEEEPENSP